MKTAVIYARYSSSTQTEQSIEGQLRDCYNYAAREGFNVIETYIDRALTGRTDNRPDFQRMISDARKMQFQYVIVYKLDRFTRNRYDSAIWLDLSRTNFFRCVDFLGYETMKCDNYRIYVNFNL
jgi:DNA invertase Pin-like site-specific DNA recombinase